MKIKLNFEWTEKISSGLCFILIILISFVVAWYTVSAGEKILDSAPDSKAFNVEKRVDAR